MTIVTKLASFFSDAAERFAAHTEVRGELREGHPLQQPGMVCHEILIPFCGGVQPEKRRLFFLFDEQVFEQYSAERFYFRRLGIQSEKFLFSELANDTSFCRLNTKFGGCPCSQAFQIGRKTVLERKTVINFIAVPVVV